MQHAARLIAAVILAVAGLDARQQNPPQNPAPQAPPPGAQRGGGRGRGQIATMTLTSPAWPDGGQVPVTNSQAGGDVSPALSWSNVPDGITSFVLIVHDLDAPVSPGTDDVLHWMVWNIPGSARALPERVPQGREPAGWLASDQRNRSKLSRTRRVRRESGPSPTSSSSTRSTRCSTSQPSARRLHKLAPPSLRRCPVTLGRRVCTRACPSDRSNAVRPCWAVGERNAGGESAAPAATAERERQLSGGRARSPGRARLRAFALGCSAGAADCERLDADRMFELPERRPHLAS